MMRKMISCKLRWLRSRRSETKRQDMEDEGDCGSPFAIQYDDEKPAAKNRPQNARSLLRHKNARLR